MNGNEFRHVEMGKICKLRKKFSQFCCDSMNFNHRIDSFGAVLKFNVFAVSKKIISKM